MMAVRIGTKVLRMTSFFSKAAGTESSKQFLRVHVLIIDLISSWDWGLKEER